MPLRCLAHGAASRALEKDRWRSTTEAGGPRYFLLDPDGVLVPSLNDPSRLHGFPKEVKPRTEEFAHDCTILLSGATLARETVYVGSDDVKGTRAGGPAREDSAVRIQRVLDTGKMNQ